MQLIDGYFPAPVNREIRPSETLGRAAYFFHADFDLGGGFRPPVSTCRRVRPVCPHLVRPLHEPVWTSRLVVLMNIAHRHTCFLAQALQTALGPSKPRGLRPQTPPYEGPGSRLGDLFLEVLRKMDTIGLRGNHDFWRLTVSRQANPEASKPLRGLLRRGIRRHHPAGGGPAGRAPAGRLPGTSHHGGGNSKGLRSQ